MTNTNEREELEQALSDFREDAIEYSEELHTGRVKSDEDIKTDSEALLKTEQRIMRLIDQYTKQREKAYGGCHNCYGKGYATANGMWSGIDTDTDIGSPGGRVSGGSPSVMKFCECERGKQLKGYVARREQVLLERVRDEVIGKPLSRNDKDIGAMSTTAKRTRGNRNQLRAEQRQALDELKEEL